MKSISFKTICKACVFILTLTVFSFATQAQNSKQMPMEQKEHVCTDACHKNGKCVMAHGEKGHVCGKECKSMMNKDNMSKAAHGEKGHVCGKECKSMKKKGMAKAGKKMKDHVCTSACQNGNHVYAHGEKGHMCGAECMSK